MYVSLCSLVGGWFGVHLVREHEGDCDMGFGMGFLCIWHLTLFKPLSATRQLGMARQSMDQITG